MGSISIKTRIGFFSQTTALGGSEVYLRQVLLSLDYGKYEAVLFCNSGHPLLREKEIAGLVGSGRILVRGVRED